MVLHFPLSIWQQLREYVLASLPNEVTGIGAIRILSPDAVEVTELFLPKQEVSAGSSKFKEGELGKIISNFVGNNPARAGDLCFRWHSHGYSDVFWSSIDEHDINEWKGNYVFNLVTNADGKVLARLDSFKPFRLTASDMQLVIDYPPLDYELQQKYADEVHAKAEPPLTEKDIDGISQDDFEFLQSLYALGGSFY